MKKFKVYWRHASESGMGHSFKAITAETPQAAELEFNKLTGHRFVVTHVTSE